MVTVKKETKKKKPARKKSGGFEVVSIRDWDFPGMNVSIYGKSGTGKTAFACTFPKPLLLVGAEDGTKTVKNVDGVDFGRLTKSEDIHEVISMSSNYQTVVLDTATYLQDRILCEILNIEELPAQKSWGMATQQQYGQCTLQTKGYLRALLDLPINVVIVAQERAFNIAEGEENQDFRLMPSVSSALSPSVTGWLNPAVDFIAQTFIRSKTKKVEIDLGDGEVEEEIEALRDEVEYCLRIGPDPIYTTKIRKPRDVKIPSVLVDATYEDLVAASEGRSQDAHPRKKKKRSNQNRRKR